MKWKNFPAFEQNFNHIADKLFAHPKPDVPAAVPYFFFFIWISLLAITPVPPITSNLFFLLYTDRQKERTFKATNSQAD